MQAICLPLLPLCRKIPAKFLTQSTDMALSCLFMKRISVPARCTQHGFTLVEVVAVMVITVTLAAWAMPKMDRAGDIGTGSAANRLVAALQYAQVLAQRQGVDTNVEISATEIKVTRGAIPGAAIDFPMGSENKYAVAIPSDVSIDCTNITYKSDGTFVPAAGQTCFVNENGVKRFTVRIEKTGYAYLVS